MLFINDLLEHDQTLEDTESKLYGAILQLYGSVSKQPMFPFFLFALLVIT